MPKKQTTSLEEGIALVRWEPRVAPHTIRRLYETDAQGIVDAAQIDDVGYALYARCLSIVRVSAAHTGTVTCPRCERIVNRRPAQPVIRCPACGWRVRSEDYHRTYEHQQLVGGGALPVFQAFVDGFARCSSPQQKMLAFDQLLHAFHGSVVSPRRPAAKNLVDLPTSGDVLRFLDALTYGPGSSETVQATQRVWRQLLPVKGCNRLTNRKKGDPKRHPTQE